MRTEEAGSNSNSVSVVHKPQAQPLAFEFVLAVSVEFSGGGIEGDDFFA